MMTSAMESKEEISDTDSGIILHSGPDSPTSPVKDLTTRAMKMKHQSLEDRLELCLLELKKLCVREAELTGKLSSDYPLMPDEKPPRVRRRIGAAFKLDTGLIHKDGEDPELHSLQENLALQLQIFDAARRLSQEDSLSKSVRKNRLQQCKREERKVKDLQEAVFQQRIRHECATPRTIARASHRDPCMSDDSSLSDVVALDDDTDCSPHSPPASGSPSSDSLQSLQGSPKQPPGQTLSSSSSMEDQCSPIQNSPWRETSLDQPYQKPNKPPSPSSSRSSSPVGPLVCPDIRALPSHFPSIKNMALRQAHSTSAPSTPELHARRQYSQSFRLPKTKPALDVNRLGLDQVNRLGLDQGRGRARLPQRRPVPEVLVRSPEYSPLRLYQSSSEDSSSEHSLPSHASSPSRDNHPTEIPKLCPPPYGFHFGARNSVCASSFNPSPTLSKNNQPQSSPSYCRAVMEEGPLSPCSPQDLRKLYMSPPPSEACIPQHRAYPQKDRPSAPPQKVLKPPPPYTRLVRTPSLREYPNHAFRVLPRDMVCAELKSWHQRNQFERSGQGLLERQGSFRMTSPISPHLPPFKQEIPGKLILQRAPDGTPVQWFVEEDAEIVSQV
ncbi:innate immunity activator protein isoform X2 [Hypomesus transpacificus]|uniref:innate immunity activator protein isoform X2 n=1 Tax=Hypomesus transpacificus TaxID=137520 RepID=UPI001F078458|nr:innate immunity activator protein isoform X2 [Hypomesus transpacificus]